VLDGSGVALLAGSLEDAEPKVVSSDVEGGGGSELSNRGGNIGAEFDQARSARLSSLSPAQRLSFFRFRFL